jgi:hypothetical protein
MTGKVIRLNLRQLVAQRSTLQFVPLDGLRVGLLAQWNAYLGAWGLWTHANDGAVICGPIRLVRGLDLWLPYKHDPRVPPGQLFVHGEDFTIANTDHTAMLLYRPIAQVSA